MILPPLVTASPKLRFREWRLMQVVIMSPMPARPKKVSLLAAQGGAQAGQFDHAAGHEGAAGVVPGAQAVGHAHGQGDDVLEAGGDLHPGHVVVGVDPEEGAGDPGLPVGPVDAGLAGQDHGRGLFQGHLLGVAGAQQDGHRVLVPAAGLRPVPRR